MVNWNFLHQEIEEVWGWAARLRRSINSYLLILLGLLIILVTTISLTFDVAKTLPGLLPAGWQGKEVFAAGPASVEEALAGLPPKMMFKSRDLLAAKTGGSQVLLPMPAGQASSISSEGASANPIEEDTAQAAIGAEPNLPPAPVVPEVPVRLVIPAIQLDAEIVPAKTEIVKVGGVEYQHWLAPGRYAVGWHDSSALLGVPGNTVLNGHHNVYGEVFARLVDLNPGDLIFVYGPEKRYEYVIANKMILPEKYQQLDVRMDNAQWILPSDDERLTLVTCWPAESNTHRLIIVASRLGDGG